MPLKAVRRALPGAVQVADRFHLWQNLAKAVERCVAAHRACLTEPDPVPAACEEPVPSAEPAPAVRPEPSASTPTAPGGTTRSCTSCWNRGAGWGLHTVHRYARAATWQELANGRWQGPRPSKLDPFKSYLDQHAGQGHGDCARLFREIRELGYAGGYSVVRSYLDQHRPAREPAAAGPADRPGGHRLDHPPPGLPHRGRPAPGSRPYWTAVPSSRPHPARSAHSPS